MVNEAVYLGQKINSQGIQPIQEKVRAITDAPAPKNVSEVRSYLKMINYYQKYLPNLSTILAPLCAQPVRKREKLELEWRAPRGI